MTSAFAFDAFRDVPARLRGGSVAIGNFDGVHRGHQAVIDRARAGAMRVSGPLLAVTFEPHPRTFFKPEAPVFRLTPRAAKAELLRAVGADGVVVLPFDADLANLDAPAFIDRVLSIGLGASHVVAGFDFHFGKGRTGTPQLLLNEGNARGFTTEIVSAFRDERGRVVSSSLIRDALADGDVASANDDLGWRWFVDGAVVYGDKRGRTLGYPTANMVLPPEVQLRHGVYAVRARVDGFWFSGAANYGRRPQFGDGPTLLETYICDFRGDLYGKTVRIEFCAFLRPESVFENVAALVARMDRDVADARKAVSSVLRAPRTPLQATLEDRKGG